MPEANCYLGPSVSPPRFTETRRAALLSGWKQNVDADAKGSYTVQLGSTKPDGLALDLFSCGEARRLGVSVNGPRSNHASCCSAFPML
jgi:hypothetical protein